MLIQAVCLSERIVIDVLKGVSQKSARRGNLYFRDDCCFSLEGFFGVFRRVRGFSYASCVHFNTRSTDSEGITICIRSYSIFEIRQGKDKLIYEYH